MLAEKDNKLVVTSSLWRSILLIIASIIMTMLCNKISTSEDVWTFEKIIWIIGIIFFGFATLYLIYRTIAKKELVIVDENGITDNSSAVSIWFIPWNDIKNIEIKTIESQKISSLIPYKRTIEKRKFISLTLNNEDKYLEQIPQRKKMFLLSNNQIGLGIVNITLVGTGVDINKFYQKLIKYCESKWINISKWSETRNENNI